MTLSRRSFLAATAATAAATAVSGVPTAYSAAKPVSGAFTAKSGRIYDPSGVEFIPVGANVSIKGAFAVNGTALGHSLDAKAWGWNCVRLTLAVTTTLGWGRLMSASYAQFLSEIDVFVTEYTGRKIVVMIEAHDMHDAPDAAQGVRSETYRQVNTFWKDIATKYKSNPYVWFNLHNEPQVFNQDWYNVQAGSAAVVRGTGAKNIIVVDADTWGGDLGPQSWSPVTGFSYAPSMAPKLNSTYGNVVLSNHNYGASAMYSTQARYEAYVDKVRAAGLSLITGEIGWDHSADPTSDSYIDSRDAAYASIAVLKSKKVGALWWHGVHNDAFRLKTTGMPFYTDGNSGNLSEGGKLMWSATH